MSVRDARVLVVDDDPLVREVLCDMLECGGYTVSPAESATAALRTAGTAHYDVLMTDLHMPDMSGLELIKRFKELDPDVLPLLITGSPSAQTLAAAREFDVADYVTKPIGMAELCAKVAAALETRGCRQRRTPVFA